MDRAGECAATLDSGKRLRIISQLHRASSSHDLRRLASGLGGRSENESRRVPGTLSWGFLEPIFEADFEENVHAYRPGRRAHHALGEVRKWLYAGQTHVVDADVAQYFRHDPASGSAEVSGQSDRGREDPAAQALTNSRP